MAGAVASGNKGILTLFFLSGYCRFIYRMFITDYKLIFSASFFSAERYGYTDLMLRNGDRYIDKYKNRYRNIDIV